MTQLNDEEIKKEVQDVENHFFTEILSVIMYLNKNGLRVDRVRDMINFKIDCAFVEYERIRDLYNDTINRFRGL